MLSISHPTFKAWEPPLDTETQSCVLQEACTTQFFLYLSHDRNQRGSDITYFLSLPLWSH